MDGETYSVVDEYQRLVNLLCKLLLVAPRASDRYQGIVTEQRLLAQCRTAPMDVDLAVIVELEKDKQRSQERCHYSSFSEFDQLKGHLIGYFRSGSYAAIRLVHDDDKIAKKHFRKLSRAVRELSYLSLIHI